MRQISNIRCTHNSCTEERQIQWFSKIRKVQHPLIEVPIFNFWAEGLMSCRTRYLQLECGNILGFKRWGEEHQEHWVKERYFKIINVKLHHNQKCMQIIQCHNIARTAIKWSMKVPTWAHTCCNSRLSFHTNITTIPAIKIQYTWSLQAYLRLS